MLQDGLRSLQCDTSDSLRLTSAVLQGSALVALAYSSLPCWLACSLAGGILLHWLRYFAGSNRGRNRARNTGGIVACGLDEDGLSLELADGRRLPVTLERAYLSTAIQVLQFSGTFGTRRKQIHFLPIVSMTQSGKHATQSRAVRLLALTGGVLRTEHRVGGNG